MKITHSHTHTHTHTHTVTIKLSLLTAYKKSSFKYSNFHSNTAVVMQLVMWVRTAGFVTSYE